MGFLSNIDAIGLGFHTIAQYVEPGPLNKLHCHSRSNTQSNKSQCHKKPYEDGDNIKYLMGINVGFLTPYLLDFTIGIGMGAFDNRIAFFSHFTPTYTYMINNFLGVFGGVGFGMDFAYGDSISEKYRDPFEASFKGLALYARIPVGVKFFTNSNLECYLELNTDIGSWQKWNKYYRFLDKSYSGIVSPIVNPVEKSNEFYWGLGINLGVRYWF